MEEVFFLFFFPRVRPHPKEKKTTEHDHSTDWSYLSCSRIINFSVLCLPVYVLPGQIVILHSSISWTTESLIDMFVEVAEVGNKLALPAYLPQKPPVASHRQKVKT